MRNQACEWEVLSDEAPRASKRKYQDLEQRSAGEHELLNHLRDLPEPDCLNLTRRLRDGCSINELLISARELSETAHSPASDRNTTTIRHFNMAEHGVPRSGRDSGSNQVGREFHPSSRPILPPISSIWYATPFIKLGPMSKMQH